MCQAGVLGEYIFGRGDKLDRRVLKEWQEIDPDRYSRARS